MRALELFSGAGGLSIGLRRAGFKILTSVEFNADAIATYRGYHPDTESILSDVRLIDFSRFRNQIDIVVGGPPCQPFSLGGLRKGNADSRDMIPEFVRCLKEVDPPFFLMENVPGLTLKSARQYFSKTLLSFMELGYVLNYAVLSAADYGVPQKRRRLFVMGAKNTNNPMLFPKATHGKGRLPYITTSSVINFEVPTGEPPNCPVKYARYPDLRPNPYAGHIYNGGGRPLDPNGPAHTILASSGGYKTHWVDVENTAPAYHAHLMEGGDPYEGFVPGARRLTVEECAILQTFPMDLVFIGRRSSQYKQVGDAVPPVLAEALGKAILFQVGGGKYCDLDIGILSTSEIQGELL